MDRFAPRVLVARQEYSAAIVRTITSGRQGTVLLGESGLGKSSVARQAIEQLGSRYRTHWLHPNPVMKSIPFGAWAPFLTNLAVEDVISARTVLKAVTARLISDRESGLIPLVVIDDAQDLDDNSAALAAQLIYSETVQTVVLSRPNPGLPDELRSLVAEGMFDMQVLRPLNRSQCAKLCRRVLGGNILDSAVVALHDLSGGNPMFLLALQYEMRESGKLYARNNIWRIADTPERPARRLIDLVKMRLVEVPDEHREVLETVALAEPVALDLLSDVGYGDIVDALVAEELVAVTYEDAGKARLAHPLYAEVLRALVSASRSRRILERLTDGGKQPPDDYQGLLRRVAWSLDCGAPIEPADARRAAYVANRLYDPRFALRALAVVDDPAHETAVTVERARAQFLSGHGELALEMLGGVSEEIDEFPLALSSALLRVEIQFSRGASFDELMKELSDWHRAIDRIGALRGSSDEEIAMQRMAGRLYEFSLQIGAGIHRDAGPALAEMVEATQQFPELSLLSHTVYSEYLTMVGRGVEALRHTTRALHLATDGGEDLMGWTGFVLHRHFFAAFQAGQLEQFEKFDAALLSQIRASTIGGAVISLALGMARFSRDDNCRAMNDLSFVAEVQRDFSIAIEGYSENDIFNVRPLALAVKSLVATATETPSDADAAIAEFEALRSPGMPLQAGLARGFLAAARYARRGGRGDFDEFHAVADAAASTGDGLVVVEFEALARAFRFGDFERIERLHELAAVFDTPNGELIGRVTGALIAADAQNLAELSDELAADQPDLSELCRSRAEKLNGRSGRARPGGPSGRPKTPTASAAKPNENLTLTRRESQVAQLIADGHGNAEIAQQLGLSVRTIEGHAYRLFGKLQISRREELTRDLLVGIVGS